MRSLFSFCTSFAVTFSVCGQIGVADDKSTGSQPAGNDLTVQSLRKYETALVRKHGGSARKVPLDVKAAHFEWVLQRYHIAPWNQAHVRAFLKTKPGAAPDYVDNADNSTWNGALLAAMSYKYAVTKDKETLRFIGRLIDGMHFFQVVAKRPGFLVRCVQQIDKPTRRVNRRFVNTDGVVYHYRGDPAKGTYNQIVAGYAALMIHVYPDLPKDKQRIARDDLSELALHLIRHDYRIRKSDGKPTSYGDLRPEIASVSVPFNAQVAYMIVATAAHFPPANPGNARAIQKEFRRLRQKHHVYYEDPLFHWAAPQRVANSPFIKGMNDRNHVINAAFTGLMLERDSAKRMKRPVDREFVYEMGRTMFWGLRAIEREHNALCNFMWAGLLKDRETFNTIVPREKKATRRQIAWVTAMGVEQLRRFPIDRFSRPGKNVRTATPQFLDTREPHESYVWKSGAYERFVPTGPPTNLHTASIDYLYAYWLMRYFGLEK